VTEPVKEEARKAAEGRAWETPFVVLGGVTVVVFAVVAVVLAIAFTVWLVL
jgi:hypothetical protein